MVGQAGTVHAHLARVASCVGPTKMAVVIVGWYMDHAAMAAHVTKPRSVEWASAGQVALVALVCWKCTGGKGMVWL